MLLPESNSQQFFVRCPGHTMELRSNRTPDCDFLIKTSNCCPSGTFLSDAQSDLGVFTTYAGIKGMPGITRKLKEAVIYKD